MGCSKLTIKVLSIFLEDVRKEQYGFALMRLTGAKSGSLYPLLDRLEKQGWIEGRDEAIDEQVEGRPKRRLYRLTDYGCSVARNVVAEFYEDLGRPPRWVEGWEGV